MDQAQIDVNGMVSAATTVGSVASDVSSEGNNVRTNMDSLMASWKGQSAMAFSTAMDSFYIQCSAIVSTLEGLSTTIKGSADSYSQTHESSTQYANAFNANVPQVDVASLPNF